MLCYIAQAGISKCFNLKDTNHRTLVKATGCLSFFEIALTLGAILVSVKILTNTLPPSLDFLKGRVGLATALGITGLTLLTSFSLCASTVRCCVSGLRKNSVKTDR